MSQQANPVQIQIESTPNPATMKFKTSHRLVNEPIDCPTAQETDSSPLAAKIFGFPWTDKVYIGEDFVTVTKQDWVDWEVLAEPLAGLIKEHIDRGEPVYVEVAKIASDIDDANDSEIVKKIKQVLNSEIRPVVALDGGDIVFAKFENQILSIHMKGACAGCPSSTATLKEGIEVRMKELFPEIKEVVSI